SNSSRHLGNARNPQAGRATLRRREEPSMKRISISYYLPGHSARIIKLLMLALAPAIFMFVGLSLAGLVFAPGDSNQRTPSESVAIEPVRYSVNLTGAASQLMSPRSAEIAAWAGLPARSGH